jgi:outer membrane biosynthesis protein TonB
VSKNEDGEFELILGNRQLLSVFFIVIVLFALFFMMGYILGRNSGPLAPEAAVHKTEKPLVVEAPGRDMGHGANPAPAAKSEPAPLPPQEKPQAPPEQPKPQEPAKVEKAPEPKPEPVKPAPPERKAEKPAPPAPASNEPSGTYLQLAATTEHEANLLAEKIRKKGFKTVVAEVPEKPGLFRVLVGPLPDGSVNRTKADLQSSGFPGDKAIKRTY